MNLEIRRSDDRTTVLCDDAGVPLPGQTAVAWDHGGPDQRAEITVRFIVDGVFLKIADGPPTGPSSSLQEVSAGFAALSPENRARFLTMYELERRAMPPLEPGPFREARASAEARFRMAQRRGMVR